VLSICDNRAALPGGLLLDQKRDRAVTEGQKAQFFLNINATSLNQAVQNVVHGNVPTVSEAVDYERLKSPPFLPMQTKLHGSAC
jgi:hypothetical protein